MNSTSSIALSGMQAAQTSLATSGHNIANLATSNFHRQVAQTTTVPEGGVTTSVQTAAEPGEDPATDMVGLLTAKNAFMANLAVFRTGDKMLGALLDEES